MAKSVDDYIAEHPERAASIAKLRKILAATALEETVKWGAPAYTLDGKIVIGIGAFKNYVGLWFHQGVFLSDPDGALVNAQDGKTKALRQWRFEKPTDIKVGRVKAYVAEAIANQRAGKEIKPARGKPVDVPPELAAAMKKRAKLRKAFDALTPGKQREYAEHIATAKREATKAARLEKITPMIEAGIGLNDKYRGC